MIAGSVIASHYFTAVIACVVADRRRHRRLRCPQVRITGISREGTTEESTRPDVAQLNVGARRLYESAHPGFVPPLPRPTGVNDEGSICATAARRVRTRRSNTGG